MINKPEVNLGKLIHIKIVIISAKLGDNVGDTYVEYNFQGKNYTTKIVIYSPPEIIQTQPFGYPHLMIIYRLKDRRKIRSIIT